MEQKVIDFIVDDGFNYDEDSTYDPNDEEEYEDDSDLSLSEFDEDDDGKREELGYVTLKLPIPLLFDEEWFKRFQILNLIKDAGQVFNDLLLSDKEESE